MTVPRPIRVFVSYAHDASIRGHRERALQLAESLRKRGVMSYIDRWVEHEPISWPRWMADQIRDADIVLCLASPIYKARCEQLGDPSIGRGAQWEGALITDAMYSNIVEAPSKFISVLLDGAKPEHIPDVLRPFGFTYYTWADGPDDDETLYRRITGQPLLTPPPLGPMVIYPA